MDTPEDSGRSRRKRPPARTPDDREQELIAKAFDLAEHQIESGTASSQVISHFLKLGSSREALEQERIAIETKLSATKIETLEAEQRIEDLFDEAIAAMTSYRGRKPKESFDD